MTTTTPAGHVARRVGLTPTHAGHAGQTQETETVSRFTYEIVQAGDRFAIIRRLASGDVAGYDAVSDRNDEQRHFAIRGGWDTAGAAADSRTYATRDAAEADIPA